MKKTIIKYVIYTEALLLKNPKDKLIESFLKKLKSLKSVSEDYLSGFDVAIPLVYEALKNVENVEQTKVMFKLFSVMVDNAKTAVEAKKNKS